MFADAHRPLRPGGRRLQALHRAEAAGADGLPRRRRRRCSSCASSTRRASTRSLAADVARRRTTVDRRASAHEMLARIALARHDADAAREEAALAHDEDPALPLPAYIDARLLYDQGKYDEALPLLPAGDRRAEEAGRAADRRAALLHRPTRSAGWSAIRRPKRSSSRSCKSSRRTSRARGGLAMLYQASGQPDDAAARSSATCCASRRRPTATRWRRGCYTMFGDRKQARGGRAPKARPSHSQQQIRARLHSPNPRLRTSNRTPRRAMRGFMISSICRSRSRRSAARRTACPAPSPRSAG